MATLCLNCGKVDEEDRYRCINCGSPKIKSNLKIYKQSDYMTEEIEKVRFVDKKKNIIRVYFKDNTVSDFEKL